MSHQAPLTLPSANILRPTIPDREVGFVDESSILATRQINRTESTSGSKVLQVGFGFLWLLTFVIYARPEDMFSSVGSLHLTFVFAALATLTCTAALLLKQAVIPCTAETKLILSLSMWFVIGIPFAFWKSGSLELLTHVWAKTVLVYFLLILTLQTLRRVYALLWAIILSELLATAFCILEPSKALWIGERIYGANAGFLAWNFLGIAAAMTIPYLAAMFIIRRSLLSTTLLIATSVSMMWMLILTASRGGFLNVVFSVVLTSVLVLRGTPRGKIAGVVIGAALLMAVIFAPPVFWDRLGTLWNSHETSVFATGTHSGLEQLAAEESTEGRLELLSRSVRYTIEHPLFGLGLGNFNLASGEQHNGQPNAWMGTHNTFTKISSEAGLPALALYLMLLVAILRSMYQIRRTALASPAGSELGLMSSATFVSVLSFVFGECVAHLAYDYYFFYIVAIAVGLRCIAAAKASVSDRGTEHSGPAVGYLQ